MNTNDHEAPPRPNSEDSLKSWIDHMRRSDFAAAWRISDGLLRGEARASQEKLPRHMRPVWRGDNLSGKRVLVRCHHGLGDTIQFIRYAPRLRMLAAEVIVAAQPALLQLLRHAAGIDRLL